MRSWKGKRTLAQGCQCPYKWVDKGAQGDWRTDSRDGSAGCWMAQNGMCG